jgi:hypothetical protein
MNILGSVTLVGATGTGFGTGLGVTTGSGLAKASTGFISVIGSSILRFGTATFSVSTLAGVVTATSENNPTIIVAVSLASKMIYLSFKHY